MADVEEVTETTAHNSWIDFFLQVIEEGGNPYAIVREIRDSETLHHTEGYKYLPDPDEEDKEAMLEDENLRGLAEWIMETREMETMLYRMRGENVKVSEVEEDCTSIILEEALYSLAENEWD